MKEVKLELIRKINEFDESFISSICRVSYEKFPKCYIHFENNELGAYEISDIDLFECLCKLRKFLEEGGWIILCNGARRDVYPSTMAREMSGGEKAYLQIMGKPAGPGTTINIFEPAPQNEIATVEEQIAFHKKWNESLKNHE
jgi:hypothetical protein